MKGEGEIKGEVDRGGGWWGSGREEGVVVRGVGGGEMTGVCSKFKGKSPES